MTREPVRVALPDAVADWLIAEFHCPWWLDARNKCENKSCGHLPQDRKFNQFARECWENLFTERARRKGDNHASKR